MKNQTQESEIDPYDYSDEAERRSLRLQLYDDLKWEGGPAVCPANYPTFSPGATEKDTEPSLETWRRCVKSGSRKSRSSRCWKNTLPGCRRAICAAIHLNRAIPEIRIWPARSAEVYGDRCEKEPKDGSLNSW